jgi:alpha-tubulin suppressor-like RCC1 family protein
LSNVVAIATGDYHSLALRRDGTIIAWGLDTYGQCDIPSGLKNIRAITAHGRHSMVLMKTTAK